MSATFPSGVRTFTSKVNFQDIVDAGDPNALQDEVTAIETFLGANPHVSTGTLTGFSAITGQTWATTKARLDNIERGLSGDAHGSIYVHQAGGDTITASTAAVVPLSLKAAASQTGDLLDVKNSSGTVLLSVESNGQLLVNNGASPNVFVNPSAAGSIGVVVRGAASQTGDLFEGQNSSGTVLFKVDASGNLTAAAGTFNGTLNATTLQQGGVAAVTVSGTQTLTNKTLTSPTINTPTVSNGTFTSPTINTATVSSPTISGATINTSTLNSPTISDFTNATHTHTSAATGGKFTVPVQIPFHVSGTLTTGLKVPKFLVNRAMTLTSARAVANSGSGVTFSVYVNGALAAGMVSSPAVGTTPVLHDFTDVSVNVGDYVQVSVDNAGTSAADLSITVDGTYV